MSLDVVSQGAKSCSRVSKILSSDFSAKLSIVESIESAVESVSELLMAKKDSVLLLGASQKDEIAVSQQWAEVIHGKFPNQIKLGELKIFLVVPGASDKLLKMFAPFGVKGLIHDTWASAQIAEALAINLKSARSANASLFGQKSEIEKILRQGKGNLKELGGSLRTMSYSSFLLAFSDRIQSGKGSKATLDWFVDLLKVRLEAHSIELKGPSGSLSKVGGDITDEEGLSIPLDQDAKTQGYELKYLGVDLKSLQGPEKEFVTQVTQTLTRFLKKAA